MKRQKENTCVYRVTGSWSSNMKEGNVLKKRKWLFQEFQKMMKEFNSYTKNKYQSITEYVLIKKEFEATTNKQEINTHKQKKYKGLYKEGPKADRIKYYLKIKLNLVYKQYKKTTIKRSDFLYSLLLVKKSSHQSMTRTLFYFLTRAGEQYSRRTSSNSFNFSSLQSSVDCISLLY